MSNAAYDELVKSLKPTYDLVYVDYYDELTEEQVDLLVRNDWESFWETLNEFASEAIWDGAQYVIDNELDQDLILELSGEELDDLRCEIEYRNLSDPYKELAHNSGKVVLRLPIDELDEDNSDTEYTAEQILEVTGLDKTKHNIKEVQAVLDNMSTTVVMGFWIAQVEIPDIYNLSPHDEATVYIKNPYLFLGNPFTGNGWMTEERLGGELRVERQYLCTDRDQYGYSVDDIYGGLWIDNSEISSDHPESVIAA